MAYTNALDGVLERELTIALFCAIEEDAQNAKRNNILDVGWTSEWGEIDDESDILHSIEVDDYSRTRQNGSL